MEVTSRGEEFRNAVRLSTARILRNGDAFERRPGTGMRHRRPW